METFWGQLGETGGNIGGKLAETYGKPYGKQGDILGKPEGAWGNLGKGQVGFCPGPLGENLVNLGRRTNGCVQFGLGLFSKGLVRCFGAALGGVRHAWRSGQFGSISHARDILKRMGGAALAIDSQSPSPPPHVVQTASPFFWTTQGPASSPHGSSL